MFLKLFGKERGLCVSFPGPLLLVQFDRFLIQAGEGGNRQLSRPAVPHAAPGPTPAALHSHLVPPTGSHLGPWSLGSSV